MTYAMFKNTEEGRGGEQEMGYLHSVVHRTESTRFYKARREEASKAKVQEREKKKRKEGKEKEGRVSRGESFS